MKTFRDIYKFPLVELGYSIDAGYPKWASKKRWKI